MKKFIFLAVTAFIITSVPSFAQQAQVNHNHTDETFGGAYLLCNGVSVNIEGTVASDFLTVLNKSRANINSRVRGTFTGVTMDGVTYKGSIISNTNNNVSLNNGLANDSYTYIIHFVGDGSAPNFILKATTHTTTNAKGETTITRTDLTSSCD